MSAISMNASPLKTKRPNSKRSWIAWAPFVALVVAGALAAAGFNVSQKAFGLGSPQNVTVQATVGPEVHFTAVCGTQGPTALTLGGTLENIGAGGCVLNFGSNNDANGVNLTIENNSATAPFFCFGYAGARNCATASYADEAAAPAGTVVGSVTAGKAGFELGTLTGTAVADVAGANAKLFGVPANGSPLLVCHTTTAADGTCNVQFAARTSAGQLNGNYEGVAKMSLVGR